jgi:lipid-A-disaccharide synthase
LSARLLLSCGELSGDLYAGALTRELHALCPTLAIAGLGGPEFSASGGQLLGDYRESAATGLIEPLLKLPRLFATLKQLIASARRDRPAALILIDFWGFNFRLARRVKRLGIPIVYYIGPQLWAWRPGRLKAIREIADRVLVIFPFEAPIYERGGVPVEFVGHPLVDLAKPRASRADFLRGLGLSPDAPTIAILPGSRPGEVGRILPDLLAAADRVRARIPAAQCVIARAPHLDAALFAAAVPPVVTVQGDADTVLAAADLAMTASGTATVQAALHDTPMVVVYRLSSLDYFLGRRLLNIDVYSMVNLIAGRRIVPELIQHAFTPEAVSDEAVLLLSDPVRAARMREGLALVRSRLGATGASRRAAEAILKVAGIR